MKKDFYKKLTDSIIKAFYKATNIEIGLLLNFGKKPEIKRKIFTNDRKNL